MFHLESFDNANTSPQYTRLISESCSKEKCASAGHTCSSVRDTRNHFGLFFRKVSVIKDKQVSRFGISLSNHN